MPPCSCFREETAREGRGEEEDESAAKQEFSRKDLLLYGEIRLLLWKRAVGKARLSSNSNIQATLKNKSNLCSEAISHARTEFQVNILPHIGAAHDTGVCICL